ncbi:MAG: response regulator [Gemmatimonadales bacterium]|nr:MAG: response regulator [Gemmatimonadales bacterium]
MSILLVEDTEVTLLLLRNIAERTGEKVICAGTGEEALRLLDEHPEVRLLVSDMMMPGMDGLELVRRIRDRPEWSDLPVLFISGVSRKEAVMEAARLHSIGWILKPIDRPSEVLNRLQGALAQYPPRLENPGQAQRRLGISEPAYLETVTAFRGCTSRALENVESEGLLDEALERSLRESAATLGARALLNGLDGSAESRIPRVKRELVALQAALDRMLGDAGVGPEA